MKQFLIIQTAFLGDAVLATALLEKLHAHYPDGAIDLVVRKGNEGLFTGHPFLRKLYVWNKRQGKNRALFRLIGEIRQQHYDHVINAQRFFSTGLMTVLSGGKETIGYDKNPLSFLFSRRVQHHIPERKSLLGKPWPAGKPIKHEVDRLNDLIAHLTDGTRPLPMLHPSGVDHRAAEQVIKPQGPETETLRKQEEEPQGPGAETLRKHYKPPPAGSLAEDHAAPSTYITVAPASVWFTKQWPAEKWIELIKILPQYHQVFLIGAPGDTALCERIALEAGRGEVLAGKLSLLATAALMEGARMNYVNDSAPLHIASAMRAPVTAVFCSTVPAFGFGPLHPNGRVVEHSEALYCRPCGLHGYRACPEGHFKCALEIFPDQVAGPMS